MGIVESNITPEISKESEEYFNLINQKIQNVSHNQTVDIRRSKLESKQLKKKKWKDTIWKYLKKQSDLGNAWAEDVVNSIKKNPFNSEGKFLDLFFWQKFEMKTKPPCLNQTFLSTTMNQSQSNLNDTNLSEYKLNKEKLGEYIQIFQRHLSLQDHPITMCIKFFIDVFAKEIQFHIGEILKITDRDERQERAQLVAEAIAGHWVDYIFKLQKCFGLMYAKVLAYKYFKQEKEEFITMFTTAFFKNKQWYSLIMELFSLAIDNDIKAFGKHMTHLSKVGIQTSDLNINEKFRLDNETEKMQWRFMVDHNLDLSDEKLIYLKTYRKHSGYFPYKTAVELLRNIKLYQTPIDKINWLASMSSDVIDNIMKGWKPWEDQWPKNYLGIDGDELILIFSFIVIKANMPELLTHLYFIKMFTTQDTKSSMIGYYYTTIEASIITVKGLEKNVPNAEEIKTEGKEIPNNNTTNNILQELKEEEMKQNFISEINTEADDNADFHSINNI